jgi:PAS domain S-box-containing protein
LLFAEAMSVEWDVTASARATNVAFPDSDARERAFREPIESVLLRSIETCAIYAIDPAGRLLSWHPGAANVTGYREREIVGRHFSIFYSSEARACGKPDRDLAAASTGPIARADWRLRKDGTWFWAHRVLTPMRDRDGRLIGFACLETDMTAHREAEHARLRRAVADTSVRLRNDFFEQARRTLNNTLMGVRLHLDSLHAAVRNERVDSKNELASRVTLLEWGYQQIAEAIERSLKIVSDTNAKLESQSQTLLRVHEQLSPSLRSPIPTK